MITLRHRRAEKRSSEELAQLGTHHVTLSRPVSNLTVRFLIDLLPAGPDFQGEAGVSYLVEADDRTILFDLGANEAGRFLTPLRQNLQALDLQARHLDGVFISHNHYDHMGGMKYQRSRLPDLEQLPPEMTRKAPVWTPTAMHHHSHKCQQITEPAELLPGLASTGPLPASLYFLGPIHEQGLIVSLGERGVALIIGCGHPGPVEMVRHTMEITGQKVHTLVGGLHLIAGKGRTRTQKYLGANQPPWRLPNRERIRQTIVQLKELGVERLAPSAHDSCDQALNAMKEVFGEGYSEVRAGGSITI